MEATLIYPHQLYGHSPCLVDTRQVFFIEEPLLYGCDNKWGLKFHARKLSLLKQAGDYYKEKIASDGFKVKTIELGKSGNTTQSQLDKLPTDIKSLHITRVVDDLLERRITTWCEKKNIELTWHPTPNFLTPVDWWQDYFSRQKKPFMANFYKAQRKRMNVLMEGKNEPQGGRWSYDDENRKKLPKDYEQPNLPEIKVFSEETKKWVKKHFPNAIGGIGEGIPHTHEQAQEWLDAFLKERFHKFGDYEDAISRKYDSQHHSLLTPMLNMGLLDPGNVVEQAIAYAEEHDVPINSLEGFVRQIIGWREFMRCMYELHGREMRMSNFWGFEHEMPECFYTGESGLPPVDKVIKQLLKTGYCHHIERLMVLGVIFQLCHIKPTSVYNWFMEMFIDSYDWVMVPNVYGMSQFADGGKFVTKPYVCGSNYIRKMSDYPKGKWCEIWDGLFWDFIAANEEFYKKQPRLGMMTSQLGKMGEEKLSRHRRIAEEYRKKVHSGWKSSNEELELSF